MPAILIALVSVLASAASTLVGRVLLALGIQYVSYKGVSGILDWAVAQAMSGFGGLPPTVYAIFARCNVDDAIAIIAGAVSTRFLVAGLSPEGTITKMVLK